MSPPFPAVKLQALSNYDFSTFVAPLHHTGITTKKSGSLLADDVQEKSRAQLILCHVFPLFCSTPPIVKIYFNYTHGKNCQFYLTPHFRIF